jgi:hypothetical protein
MGGFNLPMFIFFLLVTAVIATPFLIWSDLPEWIILLVSPLVSCLGIFSLSLILDLVERSGTTRDFSSLLEELKPDFSLPKKPRGLSCPSCGSKDIATILYGLPGTSKKLEKAIENREITLGGCVNHDEAPQWVCNGCSHKFGRLRTDGGNDKTSQ